MKIGVIGSGIVGRTLASGFLKHEHQVMLGSREPNKTEVQQWQTENPTAKVGTFEEASAFAELAVLAVAGQVAENALLLAGPQNLAGKVVIDATNPISHDPPVKAVLQFTTGPNESLGEKIQARIPLSHVVKAFNSVGNALMVNPKFEQGTPTMFYCGDSDESKTQVAGILRQFGWEPFDCGGIVAARAIEPLCMLWCIPGFLRGQWNHAFKLLTE